MGKRVKVSQTHENHKSYNFNRVQFIDRNCVSSSMGSKGELPLWRLSNAQMRSCHQHEGFSFCLYRARIWKWRWISIATMTGLAEPSQKQRLGVEPEATALLLVLVSHVLLVCTTSLRPSPHQLSIHDSVFQVL